MVMKDGIKCGNKETFINTKNIIILNKMIEKLFAETRAVGIVGGKDVAKTSLALTELIKLKGCGLDRYVYGVDTRLREYLESEGIKFLENKEDILDMNLSNAIVYLDEISDIFDVSSQSKQRTRFKRFINRLAHLNVWLFFSTAENKFWNTFVCGIVDSYLVKSIDYDALVNGTPLKRKVMGISMYSDYRLEIQVNTYYVLTKGNELTMKETFEYNKNLDSKKDNFNPFKKVKETLIKEEEKNSEEKSEIKNPFNLPIKTIAEELSS